MPMIATFAEAREARVKNRRHGDESRGFRFSVPRSPAHRAEQAQSQVKLLGSQKSLQHWASIEQSIPGWKQLPLPVDDAFDELLVELPHPPQAFVASVTQLESHIIVQQKSSLAQTMVTHAEQPL